MYTVHTAVTHPEHIPPVSWTLKYVHLSSALVICFLWLLLGNAGRGVVGYGRRPPTLVDRVDASALYFCPQNPFDTYNIHSFDTFCLLTYFTKLPHMSMMTMSKYSMDYIYNRPPTFFVHPPSYFFRTTPLIAGLWNEEQELYKLYE